MCGIFGYIGDREVVPVLVEGLKKLEYRGYDSAGIVVQVGDHFALVKSVGKIVNLEKKTSKNAPKGSFGIAHTRWATHGIVNEKNAHPHFNSNFDVAIVHNGIIENEQELRKMLLDKGITFRSDTDSELIAHLLDHVEAQNLEKSMIEVMKLIEGTFAIAAMSSKDDERKIVAARRSSPLCIGIGKGEHFVSSDPYSFLQFTNEVAYIDDNKVVVIDGNSISVYDEFGKSRLLSRKTIEATFEEEDLVDHENYMHKEMFEQPDVVRRIVSAGSIDLGFSDDYLKSLRRIVFTACGTSWHAALIGKYVFEELLGILVEVDYASEFRYRNPIIGERDFVIGISQSGETADTIAALREAKKRGAHTLALVNVTESTMAREADEVVNVLAGREVGVASTKAFVAHVLNIYFLAIEIGQRLKIIDEKVVTSLKKELRLLPLKMEEALSRENEIARIAEDVDNKGKLSNALFMGRGINFPVALEGALKLKEISYVHAEGYPAAEMKHGPIALIDKEMPSVFIANSKDKLYKKVLTNMEEVKARGGEIITIGDEFDDQLTKVSDHIIRVPRTHPLLYPLINVIPLQLLAYHITKLRGIDVDKPRNLAKSVTVE